MSDPVVAYAIIATIISIILGVIFYLKTKLKEEPAETQLHAETTVRRAAGNNRGAQQRNTRARLQAVLAERRGEVEVEEPPTPPPHMAAAAAAMPVQHHSSDEEEGDDDEAGTVMAHKGGKIGKKKAAKLQLKAEKKAQREAEEREREEQRIKDAQREEEEKLKKEEEAAEEAKRLEEEKRRQEERERKEQEEYEKMKAAFTIEESGFDQNVDDKNEEDLLHEFVTFIKQEKVVVLEELAARFRLKTQAVINRVQDLQSQGTLTGVLDERGKFIYISMDELEGIAKFIRQRGRVTLSELAEASGTLISLSPDQPVVAAS
ncbi:DDRGK domain-containing protein 1 isoform X2 [Hyalella azteca]|uniref:DDRGK domain-containing protein 1 n=1 Tax=Hyalella azteca TaxID=294128 RepID=A0A8B7NB27_HYAAZ|nr:DDRGK domain-containing protein 1 isoform X2 [Hyalella azteca]